MRVYLLLGSNRGASAQWFDAAIAALPAAGVRVCRVSPYRATRPVAASGRRDFLNCALAAETDLPPRVLLRRLRHLERSLGRHSHTRRNPPRTLDIDLIFYGSARIRTPELAVPHPRFASRGFVLQALADLDPGRRAPASYRTIEQTLRRVIFRPLRAPAAPCVLSPPALPPAASA
ncbi:MAG: 2-amino-4-hydroxy-6-hydroxymethyldihydropteridine diphosphokinase [Terriglobales bacterium]